MRIGIDARWYQITGIGRYEKNLLKELEKLDLENEYVVFLQKENFDAYQPENPNFKKMLADCTFYSFREQIIMPLKINQAKVDLMHIPNFNIPIFWSGKMVITIHDLIHQEYSTAKTTTRVKPYYYFKKLIYLAVIRIAAHRSLKIFVPSRATKKDVVQHLGVNPGKVVVTYEGLDEEFKIPARNARHSVADGQNEKFKMKNSVLDKFGIQKPYILYVGTMYPHKNHERLLQAFSFLKKSKSFASVSLVLIGKVDVFAQRIKRKTHQLGLENCVVMPGFQAKNGYLPDQELQEIYSQSSVFVFPSLKEGFGLPILEAQARGIPVVCSNISSLPEVGRDTVLYFNPLDVEEIAKTINQVFHDEKLRQQLITKGYENIKRFSWTKMAQETFRIYEEVLHT